MARKLVKLEQLSAFGGLYNAQARLPRCVFVGIYLAKGACPRISIGPRASLVICLRPGGTTSKLTTLLNWILTNLFCCGNRRKPLRTLVQYLQNLYHLTNKRQPTVRTNLSLANQSILPNVAGTLPTNFAKPTKVRGSWRRQTQ